MEKIEKHGIWWDLYIIIHNCDFLGTLKRKSTGNADFYHEGPGDFPVNQSNEWG